MVSSLSLNFFNDASRELQEITQLEDYKGLLLRGLDIEESANGQMSCTEWLEPIMTSCRACGGCIFLSNI